MKKQKKKFAIKSKVKKLQLDKQVISGFDAKRVKGGRTNYTVTNCDACTTTTS